jgi:transposase
LTTTPAGWCGPAPGRDRHTVETFLDLLGNQRCHQVKLVSCDMASWITGPVGERCPNANVCYDPFHLIKLSTDALDEIRREVWNDARRQGQTQLARELKGARFALWKNPGNLTDRQAVKLSTSGSTAPTSSPNSCARSTACRSRRRSRCSTGGSNGPGDLAFSRSSSSPAPSPSNDPGSRPRFGTDCPTLGSSK